MAKKAKASSSSVPTVWPGAFGIYQYSRNAVRFNIWTLVLLWALSLVISGGLNYKLHADGSLIGFLIGSLVTAAYSLTYLAGVHEKKLSFGDSLSQGVKYWFNIIVANILTAIALVISLLLLIVPFFFVLPRLMLVNYFIVDKKLDGLEAIKASWAATEGHALKVWRIIGVNLLIAALSLTIIGIPFAIYFLIMYSGAFAVLYESLKKKPAAK